MADLVNLEPINYNLVRNLTFLTFYIGNPTVSHMCGGLSKFYVFYKKIVVSARNHTFLYIYIGNPVASYMYGNFSELYILLADYKFRTKSYISIVLHRKSYSVLYDR